MPSEQSPLAERAKANLPGISACLIVAAAAKFLSEHYGAPVMLFALLLGMAVNFLTESGRACAGIDYSSKALLRVGVALLGLRIGWLQIAALGWHPVLVVVAMVGLTIGFGIVLARLLGFGALFGLLSGGATAICGASAALALSAALPHRERKEQATLFTVIGVSTLSTLAMIAYPLITHQFGLNDHKAGIFIGATIHDVAQVVGAGYAISPEAGDMATIVKLLRVALLLPVILIAGQIARKEAPSAEGRPPLLPMFVVAFVALVAVNSLVALPAWLTQGGSALSSWCLVTAMSAIGMKTRLGDLVQVGIRPVILMVAETLFLACLALGLICFGAV